jgi:hypothetical protein
MPTFRCEYSLSGDLVLLPQQSDLAASDGLGFAVTLRNGPANNEGHVTSLIATIIGPATDLDCAEKTLRSALARLLDLLAFVTQSRFKIEAPLRLFEWNEGQVTRQGRLYHTRDVRDPPQPALRSELVEAATALASKEPPPFVRTALRYFRYGLMNIVPEDQFMRLWLALETIAESTKERTRVPISCAACGANMKCNACGDEPKRAPMAKQAIEDLIKKITGERAAPGVSKRQRTARNGLMHGRSPESIEDECGVPFHAIVDELGRVVWHAIMLSIKLPDAPVTFGHRGGEFTNKTLTLQALVTFDHNGEGPHPAEDRLPQADLTLVTRFATHQAPSDTGAGVSA